MCPDRYGFIFRPNKIWDFVSYNHSRKPQLWGNPLNLDKFDLHEVIIYTVVVLIGLLQTGHIY